MREIKFRAWHTVKKVMFSAEGMADDQLTLLPTGSFINVSSTSTRLSKIYPRDKFIPLQFTGLKDKNGKEIYEGDILRASPRNKYVVVFKDGAFAEAHYPDDGWIHWLKDAKETRRDKDYVLDEVIGNIYENPELLEKV